MGADVREILQSVVSPEGRVKLGSLLAGMGRQAKLTDKELDRKSTRLNSSHG